MNDYLIELKNISKTFLSGEKKINLFRNLNLKIKKGELIALIGPSGSGKSTFLHMLALLEQPNSGKIFLSKKEIAKMSENERDILRRKDISIIFQNNNLLNDFTALENVLIPLFIKGEKGKKTKEKALKIMSEVKLQNRLNHFPSELSGGEQQRVAIARALISDTRLILADEPTGNLDSATSQNIFQYFKKLQIKDKAILFATHNRELANMADYKLSILNSKLIRDNGK
ncbi:MAG: lipoprotein-releasing system ATP-binding protein LolD [Candidatus Pelagibacter sp.]|nr:lipoprotein-releasing system ATP-binding protein LolD [Candidatus Pelagibacter sp.]OUW23490.1 MAG: lipoprotein-releasing system ATP-binding protein LolD [Rickettsiales bacterium TMED174]|tara:strand:+ start:428 stop:1114 length:687 start_codon:yes stop_codon:yes gene_type:complete